MVELDDAGVCQQTSIALGAVSPKPFRAHAAEALLKGKVLDSALIAEAARLAAESTRPIDDIRGTAAYRKRVVAVTVRRLLTKAVEVLK